VTLTKQLSSGHGQALNGIISWMDSVRIFDNLELASIIAEYHQNGVHP
jgi:hypothetical protein